MRTERPSYTRHPQTHRLQMLRCARSRFLWMSIAGALMLSGCLRGLDGVSCPCVDGWNCCLAENVCVRDGDQCPNSATGGASSATTADAGGGRAANGGETTLVGGALPTGGSVASSTAAAIATGGVAGTGGSTFLAAGGTATEAGGATTSGSIAGTGSSLPDSSGGSAAGAGIGGAAASGGLAASSGGTEASSGGAGAPSGETATTGGAGGTGITGSDPATTGGQTSSLGGAPCVGQAPDNYGYGCGECGGRITCDGGCSIATPENWGSSCDTCGDIIQCDGSCPVVACLDQSFSAVNNVSALINEGSRWVGQTYTAAKTGRLVGVAVDVGVANPEYSLRIVMYDAGGGMPIASLGEVTLPTSDSPLGDIVSFANSIHQIAGHQYAIAVDYPSAPAPGFNAREGTWFGSSASDYVGGESIISADGTTWTASDSSVDLRFATYVMPD